MSSWETLSYKEGRQSPEHITRFTSGDKERVQEILIGSKGTCFDGDVCWLSHDVGDAYLVRVSDTSDTGVVIHAFGDEQWSVLEAVPDWVAVGGNWGHMDE